MKDITQILEARVMDERVLDVPMDHISITLEAALLKDLRIYLAEGKWHAKFNIGTPRDGRQSLNAILRAGIYKFLWEMRKEFDPEGTETLEEYYAKIDQE